MGFSGGGIGATETDGASLPRQWRTITTTTMQRKKVANTDCHAMGALAGGCAGRGWATAGGAMTIWPKGTGDIFGVIATGICEFAELTVTSIERVAVGWT